MFDTIVSYFNSIPFFSSAAFGILAMVIQGCSGCAVGLIMGAAPKRGVDPGLVQFLGAFVSIPVSIAIMVAGNAYPQGEFWPVFWTCASSFYTGASNFIMLLIMSSAMQSGPNGIIWAIAQSAFIFPFIISVAFFGVELTFLRLAGIIILLVSVVLYGAIKDNSTKSGHWKLKAFICLAMCAVQQNITLCGFQITGQQLHQSGFTVAAGCKQSNPLPLFQRQADIFQYKGFFSVIPE
jgi:hypothetical protein